MNPNRSRRRRLPRRPRLALAFDLRKAMFVLPNLFTLSSVFCGFYAIVQASGDSGPGELYRASLAVFFGIFFDMADGRVARLTKTQSALGVQLDSLSDLVTFGVAPALIVFKWGFSELGWIGIVTAFLYVACGTIRLARFNVLAERAPGPMKYFIGVPIPLAAGVLVSLVMFHQQTIGAPVTRTVSVATLVIILSYLMISNVRYRTFKDLKLTKKSMTVAFSLFIIFTIVAARVRPAFAVLAYFGGYLTLGLMEEVIFFRRRRSEPVPAPEAPSKSQVSTREVKR